MHELRVFCVSPLAVINRDSMFVVDGHMVQMPVRQLSIVAPTKKHMHGALQKDVKVRHAI